MVLPIVFIPFIINFPVGLVLYWMTTNLWTVGQGLVTRRLVPKPAAAREALVAHAAEARSTTATARGAGAGRPQPAQPCAAAQGQAQEEEAERAVTDDGSLQVEATGETVGEAKWAALRELERLRPGIDKAAVRFQVVSEGERGLLGVGYAPARVVARSTLQSSPTRSRERRRSTRGELAAEVRDVLEHILDALGVRCRDRDRRGRRADRRRRCVGRELGLLIGKHGQTIDAIQYLANAIVWRGRGDERKADGRGRGRLPGSPRGDARATRRPQRRACSQTARRSSSSR